MTDQRPDPKPRKNMMLWQAYLQWDELVEMRKRHNLRLSSIEAGKSNMNPGIEKRFLEHTNLDDLIDDHRKFMIECGEGVGDVWDWLTKIKGLGQGGLAAQLLAQIDDIGKFDTVSKLWRFAGLAVIDGRREMNKPGEKSHFNARLKSICWLISDQFVKQNTPLYRDIYDAEKARQRRLHPEKIVENGKTTYNDGHIDNMARRKAVKIFLQHLWVVWRSLEGLPVSEPYVQAILKHTSIVEPEINHGKTDRDRLDTD